MIGLVRLVLLVTSATKLSAFYGRFGLCKCIINAHQNFVGEQLGTVSMYTKLTCPYCEKAKLLLENQYGLRISFIDIEESDRYECMP